MREIFLATKSVIHRLFFVVDIVENRSSNTDRRIRTYNRSKKHQCRESYECIRTKEEHGNKNHNKSHGCIYGTPQAHLDRIFKNLFCSSFVMRFFVFIGRTNTIQNNNRIIDTISKSG